MKNTLYYQINNLNSITPNPIQVKYCSSIFERFRGLMLTQKLQMDEGVLLVSAKESVMNASIHMFFMNYEIAVIWLDTNKRVIDKTIAKPWRPMYKPKTAARFILEIHSSHINHFQINDQVVMKESE